MFYKYLFIFLLCLHSVGVLAGRIISTAPGLTETLFALGVSEDIVAVSRYCDYPTEAKTLPKVGGYYDLNLEMILRLSPDVVFFMEGNDELKSFLKRNGIRHRGFTSQSMEDVLAMISGIGEELGKEEKANQIVNEIKAKLENTQKIFSEKNPVKVLLVIDQEIHQDKIEGFFVAGKDEYYSQILEILNFENVLKTNIPYPRITKEALYYLRPDKIIVLGEGNKDCYELFHDNEYNPDVIFIDDVVMRRPGPRIIEMLGMFIERLDN